MPIATSGAPFLQRHQGAHEEQQTGSHTFSVVCCCDYCLAVCKHRTIYAVLRAKYYYSILRRMSFVPLRGSGSRLFTYVRHSSISLLPARGGDVRSRTECRRKILTPKNTTVREVSLLHIVKDRCIKRMVMATFVYALLL